MSTTSEQLPGEPPQPAEHHDELTGAFGFFRKYQKLILYTAGIFALITFSISASMTQWMRGLTATSSGPMPTIQVDGRKVELQVEDNEIGGQLSRRLRTLPTGVLPEFVVGKDANDLSTRFAILRRAAIASGLDVSMAEVDKAIDVMVRTSNAQTQATDTATQLALQRGYSSLAEYRLLVKEGMLVGNYVLLQTLGVDVSEAAAVRQLLESDASKKVTAKVATFDMKALEASLKAEGAITEDDIRKWMEAKSDEEKTRLEVFDTNRVSLVLGILRYDQFDAAQWTEQLAGFEFGDQQKGALYKQEQDRFKDEKGKLKPSDDPEVSAMLEKIAKADEVLNKILQKMREAQSELLRPLVEEQSRNMQEKFEAQRARDEAKEELAGNPDDEALKTKVMDAENAFIAKENASKAADQKLEDARKTFDFRGKWDEFTKDKAGAQLREVTGLKNATELKDLSSVELGTWKTPERATSMRAAGDLGVMPERATNGAFLMQATEVVVRPMKAWADIKAHLEDMYYREKAKATADDKKKVLADELLRLGREKEATKVAELEGKVQAEIDKRFSEWEQKLQGELAAAQAQLAQVQAGTQAYNAWERQRAIKQAQLDAKEKQKAVFETEVKNETEAEIKKLAKAHYGSVLEAAAQTAGFAVTRVGPYRRDLRNQPNFDKRYERTVVFLWGGLVNELEVGEATDIVEDTVERRYQIAVCEQLDPLTVEDLTRREYSQKRLLFPLFETMEALTQSFTMEALRLRYDYQEPVGRQIDPNK